MHADDFTTHAPGDLVEIPGGVAFVPEAPPRTVAITHPLLRAFDDARGSLGEFVGHAELIPNEYLITTPLLTIEAVESNRIEGTHTIIAEVLRQHVGGPPNNQELADRNLEVLLYRAALGLGDEWIQGGGPMNQAFVRALHAELLRTGRGASASPGAYRELQVAIGARTPAAARYVPPPPGHVVHLMADLEQYLVTEPELPALIACGIVLYQFEAIHPFEDGNGRIGRLLIPLYLLARGVIPRPVLYLSAYFEAHSADYYNLMKRVSTHGDWESWLTFFLEAVAVQARDSRDRVQRIIDLRDAYVGRVRAQSRSQAALAAVDLLISQIFVTIPELSRYANCEYNTAKAAVHALERMGILVQVDGSQPATWAALDLLNEIYYGAI